MNSTPELTEQTRGWLRYIWRKSTTPDDWSAQGKPLGWWDRDSTAPMCSFPRFDLGETSYILPVVADMTPAWREVYTRIADELVGRHTTFWAAIDWLTMIGHDPDQQNYPQEWQNFLPEGLRGRYDSPGWVANGVAPWGLQPDPIGADGNLFFRGFLNLLLSVYKSVSGDDKWEQPFAVTGYGGRRFDWTHTDIARFIHDQWAEQPQGAHCENTKIWPYCLSAAGLGLQLHDKVNGGHLHSVYDQWIDYAQRHFLVKNSDGDLSMFPLYYDPLEDVICSFPDPFVAYAALVATPYILPQAPKFGAWLYEQAAHKLGWSNPKVPLLDIIADPRFLLVGLLVARELGDSITEARLREAVHLRSEPRWFGEAGQSPGNQFGYWFGLDETWPRGQLSALLVLCETGEPGDWCKAFNTPNREKFEQPTVEGIDYPAVDVLRAWNHSHDQTLEVHIAAGEPARRGAATQFKVTQLADPGAVSIRCDGESFEHWRVTGQDSIEIETDIEAHRFSIACSSAKRASTGQKQEAGLSTQTKTEYTPAAPSNCSCC